MERKRERDAEQVFLWDPFKNAPLSPPVKRLESVASPERVCRKRTGDDNVSSGPVSKKGNFEEWTAGTDENGAGGGKRRLSGFLEEEPEGFKRCRPVYWRPEDGGVKRTADQDVTFLVATKKGRAGDSEEPGEWPLIVSRPDRVTLLSDDDDDDEPWFQKVQLSRVPRPIFAEKRPEHRMVVWQDQEEMVRERWGRPHPPLEAARGRGYLLHEPPRVEVLDSSEDEGDEGVAQAFAGDNFEDLETGPMPMDLTE